VPPAAGEGKTVTFEQFVALRGGALLRFATVLTGDRGTAEDVVQEALVRTHRRWHRIEPLEQPEAYVRRMIINEYLSWRRRWSRQVPVEQPNPPPSDAPDHATAYVERAAIAADLARLPRQQRAVLVLRYYAGFTDAGSRRRWAARRGRSAGTPRGRSRPCALFTHRR
jgi:RNA polymerase sigma factor (sigma-70 family)